MIFSKAKLKLSLFFLSAVSLQASKVVFISNWPVDELLPESGSVRNQFSVHCIAPEEFFKKLSPFDEEIQKVIVVNRPFNGMGLLPREKTIFFLWEPYRFNSQFYDAFSSVYTWDDFLVDGSKFIRFNYPFLMPMQDDIPCFEERKLCTLIAGNWVPHRIEILNFFKSKPRGEFEFYGWGWPALHGINEMYQGVIPGTHSGNEKIGVLKKYRFCFCFENTIGLNGYITEKIFSCFAAGCIPIYWGPKNITEYIPKGCFIDYRDFKSNEELYQYLKKMPKGVYQHYLERIEHYLKSERAQIFSKDYFDELLYEAIKS